MTYTEAQTEFSIRLYRWAKTALEREILEGFPGFQLVKEWSLLRCRFLQTLDPHSQFVFGRGLLQLRHQNAVKVLGEVISGEAEILIRREDAFRSEHNAWAQAATSESNICKPALATRRELKKAIAHHFRAAFGEICVPLNPSDARTGLHYRIRCHGWIVTTEFEFGRWDPEITFIHDVWNGKFITKDEPHVLFVNCLGFQLSYGNELGIGAGWEGITVESIDPTCLAIIEHCRRMFDVFPLLLEGLDLGRLTP